MDPVLEIDIGHPPLRAAEAEETLHAALRKILLSSSLRILKIIHGYGSSGRGGSLKTLTKDFAYRNRSRIRKVFQGENCSPFDADVREMLKECRIDMRTLDAAHDGVTVIWVK